MSHQQNSDPQNAAIAIIGLSGRFPGADTAEALWSLLAEGREGIVRLSETELAARGVPRKRLDEQAYVPATAMLEGPEYFDASFFGIAPAEAEAIDPQHRVFLECAYAALEDAGMPVGKINVPVGVYAGVGFGTYLFSNAAEFVRRGDEDLFDVLIGNDKDFLCTRTSYFCNLTGPSMAVQTACSSSLVAVHLACQSLLGGECDVALAGGVSIAFPHGVGYLYQEGGILSPDGHCRPFDAHAGGTVGGNGAGVVVLKRLADALADGDRIRAVIRGTAVNNDGRQKVGFTAPLSSGQAEVIQECLAVSGVSGREIDYIECHGTGTPLGDPIEIEALNRAFGLRREEHRCLIGSLKSNIGHLDAAAGVAGLIKLVLALENEALPASLHYREPNPQIPFADGPFAVNDMLRPWPRNPARPRRAGLSSFGIGGTNAHIIVEEPPLPRPSGASRSTQVLPLSAKTEGALHRLSEQLAKQLQRAADGDALADVAFSLALGRTPLGLRRAVVASTPQEAATALRQEAVPERAAISKVAFLFPGQGAQRVRCGQTLYRTERVFRESLDECAELARAHLGADLLDLLFLADADQLKQTHYAQPCLFAFNYALARQWQHWGVEPVAMLGHSLGEYVAACLAGVFSLEDALHLVCARGQLMQSQPSGAMLAVALSEAELMPLLTPGLDLAAINAPRQCVISGSHDAIEDASTRLAARQVVVQRLETSHAFHSAMMTTASLAFRKICAGIRLHAPSRPFLSNVSGNWITPQQATDPDYWTQHIRQPVRFHAGLQRLVEQADTVLLEVGPGQTLTGLARQGAAARAVPSLRTDMAEERALTHALAELWRVGVAIDWPRYYAEEQRNRTVLPTYPFERQRHFIEPARASVPVPTPARTGLTRADAPQDWFWSPSWQRVPLTRDPLPDGPFVIAAGSQPIARQAAAALARRLQAQNRLVYVAASSPASHGQAVDPGGCDGLDYGTLAATLAGSGAMQPIVLHCASLTVPAPHATGHDLFDETQAYSLIDLMDLVRALFSAGLRPLRMVVASNGLFDVTGDERLQPYKATLLGPCRTLPLEFPETEVTVVDLDLAALATPRNRGDAGQPDSEPVADILLAELCAATPVRTVAWRGRHRWLETFAPLTPSPAQPSRLRRNGVYMITGGRGGVGSAIARKLAAEYNAKLIITSRANSENGHEMLHLRPSLPDEAFQAALSTVTPIELGRKRDINLGLIARHEAMTRLLDEICAHRALGFMTQELGPDRITFDHSIAELVHLLAIDLKYHRFFRFMMDLLLQQGLAQRTHAGLRIVQPFDAESYSDKCRRFIDAFPEHGGIVTALDRYAARYREFFQGMETPLSLLFAEGTEAGHDKALADVKDLPWSSICEELLREFVLAIQREAGMRPIRILEIGGGEGFLTWPLVQALKNGKAEYVFTDIGKAFVLDASRRAAAENLTFITCQTFDISKPPEAQGLLLESFDVIVGLNVMHASPRLDESLTYLRRLLVPGGFIALVEATKVPHWFTMTMGTLADWWGFQDAYRGERHSPLLNAAEWQTVFADGGLESYSFPGIGSASNESEDHILLVARRSLDETPAHIGSPSGAAKQEGDVLTVQCDLTDPEQVGRAIKLGKERFGRIDGIFHAAADTAGDQLLLVQDEASAGRQLAIKAKTAIALEESLRGEPLDFQMYFSSTASFAPARGQSIYASANNFLDAYASASACSSRPPTISINWPIWQNTGMAKGLPELDRDNRFAEIRKALTIEPDQAVSLVFTALSLEPLPTRIAICPVSPSEIIEKTTELWQLHQAKADTKPDAAPLGDVDNAATKPCDEREALLHELWCEFLGVDAVCVHMDFYAIGGDSLLAINIINAARSRGLRISTKDFLLNRTIRTIAAKTTMETLRSTNETY